MAGAVAVHVPAGFFAMGGGYEYPAFLGFAAAAIGLTGPGEYSLDHLTCHVLDRPWVVALAFAGSALAAATVVGRRAKGQAPRPHMCVRRRRAVGSGRDAANSATVGTRPSAPGRPFPPAAHSSPRASLNRASPSARSSSGAG